MNDYITLKIPRELVDAVEKKIKKSKLGYTSVPEFVKTAIRHELGVGGGA